MSGFTFVTLVFWLFPLLSVVLMIVALLSLAKADVSQREFLVWLAIIVFAPVIGPLVWFVMSRAPRAPEPDAHVDPIRVPPAP